MNYEEINLISTVNSPRRAPQRYSSMVIICIEVALWPALPIGSHRNMHGCIYGPFHLFKSEICYLIITLNVICKQLLKSKR